MDQHRGKKSMGRIVLSLLVWLTIPVFAQGPDRVEQNPDAARIALNRGTPALSQMLRELHTRASLILFTAHPDDEDGGMLAYESREVGADTNLFTLNRGEGGQNVMSADFWDQLGLVRTQELLAADRYYGVHQYWSRVADFGFTKTKEEALSKWGHDRLLYDSVRVVRMTRPLVVTSVFAGNVSDGHGQHQVAGEMAQEVYKAAADPNIFPDQIRDGLRSWAPLKVYVRLPFAPITDKGVYDYATGNWAPARYRNYVDQTWIEGKPATTLQVPAGQYSPALGLSYFQIARDGLGQQKSQNDGVGIPEPGPVFSAYHRYASRISAASTEQSFFDGIDVSLMGIANYAPAKSAGWIRTRLATINALIEASIQKLSVNEPGKIARMLAQGSLQTDALIREIEKTPMSEDARYNMLHELNLKRVQFNSALVDALGISVNAVVMNSAPSGSKTFGGAFTDTFQTAIPGQKFHVRVHIANQGNDSIVLKEVRLESNPDTNWKLTAEASSPAQLDAGEAQDIPFAVTVPEDATITKPYFTRPSIEQPYYDITNAAYLNSSHMPYPLSAKVTVTYRGAQIVLDQVVQTIQRFTGLGPVLNPLTVSPAISVWVSPAAGIVPLTSKSFKIAALIHSNVKGPASGSVALRLPKGWNSEPSDANFSIAHDGDEQSVSFLVMPNTLEAATYPITVAATYQGHRYVSGSMSVGYPGLRPDSYYRDASYRATGVDVHLPPGIQVGYITGTGDSVPASLEDIGIDCNFLSAQDIATGDLGRFNAIVLGVRAYAVRPELKAFNARLLGYVKSGGTLIVQYNTPEFDHDYGPYPYVLSGNPEKVIDEASKVTLLQPDFPALTWPNTITAHDFDGWVEERGHGFMKSWDPRYIALTETHDPDQSPQKGGLLVAPYGKGFYVYAGYAFYRQMPEGVPGAFRIFANLLSLSSKPGMQKISMRNDESTGRQ